MRPTKAETAVHGCLCLGSLFFLVDLGVMPATNVAVVLYLVAIVYLSTYERYSDFVTFSHIPQALHFHRLLSSCHVGSLSLSISYAMLMRPYKAETAVHGC